MDVSTGAKPVDSGCDPCQGLKHASHAVFSARLRTPAALGSGSKRRQRKKNYPADLNRLWGWDGESRCTRGGLHTKRAPSANARISIGWGSGSIHDRDGSPPFNPPPVTASKETWSRVRRRKTPALLNTITVQTHSVGLPGRLSPGEGTENCYIWSKMARSDCRKSVTSSAHRNKPCLS
ncbi:uncharacterized protein BJX67DRAFT_158232 [Aspergillus lucknowensis]|uniref:Uncharacterized protein n=1 Tax=Aspergillus lucknowensis TaxID=176173 RepID=A0ABR4M3V4_9EURO